MSFCLHDPDILAVDSEQVIAPVICFLVIRFLPCLLSRYWFVSYQQHMCPGFFSFAFTLCWLTLSKSLFRFYCIWHCLLTGHWFVQCSRTCKLGLSRSIILVQWLLLGTSHCFNRFVFIWILCIYIILDKVCYILYVFGLNSTVCSHIVGVHLSIHKVIYHFMMDADLYNSFLLRLRIKSFKQPSLCISLWC